MSEVAIELTSGIGAAGGFHIRITRQAGDPAWTFRIGSTGSPKREYRIDEIGHDAYLDLFAGIARDLGTRMPRNRIPAAAPRFRAPLRPLLTENLSPDILYGYGDPAVLRVDGDGAAESPRFYAVVTSNDAPHAFPILRSDDLERWDVAAFVFPVGEAPRWTAQGAGTSDFWAPELHRVGGEYRVYFAARERDGHGLALGVATSRHPEGPFVGSDEPLVRGNVIDPHLLVDRDGSALLFWKEDANDVWPSLLNALLFDHGFLIPVLFPREEDARTACLLQAMWPWVRTLEPMERFFAQQVMIEATTSDFAGFRHRLSALLAPDGPPLGTAARTDVAAVLEALTTPIYGQRLTADGRTLVGERAIVMVNDQEWEAHLVEGVWVSEHGGRYYMLYAGNDFSTARYGIGVAIATSPLGPYRKLAEPLLRSTAEWSGPGHPSVAMGLDGRPRLFLHAFHPGRAGYKQFRALLTVPVSLEPDRVVLR